MSSAIDTLSIVNPTPTKLPGTGLLHDLVASKPNHNNNAIEYTAQNGTFQSLSYEQLHSRSDTLAYQLRSIRASKRPAKSRLSIVPIFIEQSLHLYISQLATLKAGAAFCPIPLDAPSERIRFILGDVDANILLTTSRLKTSLPRLDSVEVICIDDDLPNTELYGSIEPIDPSYPAYIMYTSGSTGTPKGVIISHSAAFQALLAHDRHIPEFSRFLQFANPTFDVSVFEIFFPLFRGATLISCERRLLLNDLPGVINRLDVDAAELTPSAASSLLGVRSSVSSLRLLLTIGEMLQRSVIEEYAGDAQCSGILVGAYGPSEATIHCTLQVAFDKQMTPNNIGIPLDTVSAFVVRPADGSASDVEILSIGEEGELAVGGYQLADGYLNRPEQTAAAFVDHPQYGRLYRTGDRARLTQSGRLECLGRISSGQVKLRGQRIELGEVEYAARRTPGCRAVVAEVIDGALVIFCIRDSHSIKETDIHHTCQEWLPTFMVPGAIVLLDELPYLASGKVDRKALQSLHNRRNEAMITNGVFYSPQAQEVIHIVASMLGCSFDKDVSLQSAGMDSLTAIRIATRLRRHGLQGLDANTLLTMRTVNELVTLVDQAPRLRDQSHPAVDVSATFAEFSKDVWSHGLLANRLEQIEDTYPCTPMQSAMLGLMEQDAQAYCNWVKFALTTEADAGQVEQALRRLTSCHELLRAGFVSCQSSIASYAVVVWQHISSSQIKRVEQFEYAFTISSEHELLRPISIQIQSVTEGFEVLLHIHHALYDQWSIDILKGDLGALLHGQDIPRRTFRPVAAFYASIAEAKKTLESTDFWAYQLQDMSPTKVPQLRGQRVPKALARTNWQSSGIGTATLQAFSRQRQFSNPSVFQAALAYLLGVYTGSTDVVFGLVLSGRHIPVPEIDTVVGPVLTTLPFRVDRSKSRTCMDLLSLIHEQNREIQRHSILSPAEIKQACRWQPGVTMFDTLFVWQETSLPTSQDLFVREIDSVDHHEFNVVLELEPSDGDVLLRATYNQSLISPDQATNLLNQISCIAQRLVQEYNSPVSDLDLAFTTNLLSVWNPSPAACFQDHDIVDCIYKTMDEHPCSTAVMFVKDMDHIKDNIDVLTYAQLRTRTNRLAHHLMASGIVPGDLVCIFIEKSLDLYVAILATLVVGAGYLPILPETPPARVKKILSVARPKMSLCDEWSAPMMTESSAEMVAVVSRLDLRRHPTQDVVVSYVSTDIAYTVFTSGSTGEPKGVAVTRANLAGNIAALIELYNVSPGDRLLQACSQAFDVGVFETFFALSTGMILCSATKETLFQNLENSIRAMGITHLSLTPTVAALIVPNNVPSVRFLVTSGEGVTDVVHQKWAGRGLHQGYGPSELTNICTINMNMLSDDLLGNIGTAFRNTSAFVVAPEEQFRVLPSGSFGEFAFGGEQVFQGYLGMDTLNASKIVSHPKYGRIYKSGDMGRMLADGTLLIGGRIDDQVKIRGNRVELGEINATVLKDANVSDSATLLIHGGDTRDFLATFWVPMANQSATRDVQVVEDQQDNVFRLFQRLEESLQSYMVPEIVVPISEMPLTSQGKLDKRMLRLLHDQIPPSLRDNFSRHSEADQYDGSGGCSPDERSIIECLLDILRIRAPEVHRRTSFFAIGLNSLNAIAFARSLEKHFGRRFTVAQILSNTTAARLAAAIAAPREPVKHSPAVHSGILQCFSEEFIDRVKADYRARGWLVDRFLPCTPLQEAMLSASVASSQVAYCNTTVLKISGDIGRLRSCWEEAIRRHDILRTKFVETDSLQHPYAQVVLKEAQLPWHTSSAAAEVSPTSIQADTSGAVQVDLTQPFRILEHRSASASYLELALHHAAYDGVSFSILLQEIEIMFRGHHLPPPVPFDPFLEEMLGQSGPESKAFWSKQLLDFEPKLISTQASDKSSSRQLVVERTLTADVDAIRSYCSERSVTSLSIFQAAVAKLLSCCHDNHDICFGSVVSGRTVPLDNTDRIVAPCFNTVPMRVDLSTARTHANLTEQLHQQSTAFLNHQLTPLRTMQALSRRPGTRLFDVLVLVQPPAVDLDSDIWTKVSEAGSMDVLIVVEIIPQEAAFNLRLHFTTPLISTNFAESFADAFNTAIASILTYPSSMTGDFVVFDHLPIANSFVADSSVSKKEAIGHGSEDSRWSSEEALVREVFAALTGNKSVSIRKDTSMYQVGLDSLNAAQIAARLRKLGLKVDAMDVIENLTPAAIASVALEKDAANAPEKSAFDLAAFDNMHRKEIMGPSAIPTVYIEAVRPCTAVQSGMLAQSIQTSGSLYVNHITYAVPEACNASDIQNAWNSVQRRHPILRTVFRQLEDAQHPFAMVVLSHDGASRYSETVREHTVHVNDDLSDIAKEIVDNLGNPLWRVTVFPMQGHLAMRVSIHHALYDAASLHMMQQDFEAATKSNDIGPTISIDAVLTLMLRAQYDQQTLSEDFWRQTLEKVNFQKFPNLHPTVVQTSGLHVTACESTLSLTSLEKASRDKNVTIQAIGQTAWALLLAAYSGDPIVTFGTVFSSLPATDKTFAAFPTITTVPVLCDTSFPLADVTSSMVTYNASAQRHRFTPLGDIQRFAGSADRSLFDTVFVYQKLGGHNSPQSNWPVIEESAAVDYKASMELETTSSDRIALRFTVNSGHIPAAHASLMLKQYDHILTSIVNQTGASALDDPTIHSIVAAEHAELPSKVELLHELVEERAALQPDSPALRFVFQSSESGQYQKSWSYRQLNESANQIAHLIYQQGVKPGGIVAVCMRKSPEASIAFLGILKVGCSFLAMDPDLPLARRKFIMEDSKASLLLINDNSTRNDLIVDAPIVELGPDSYKSLPLTKPNIGKTTPSAVSYILYTSGTTGDPKGCELTHENAVQVMMAFQRLFAGHWDPSSRWLQFASYWFDVSVLEHFWSWSVGITLICAPRDIVLDDLAGFLRQQKITHIDLTPALARLVSPDEIPSLQRGVFITGGEALRQEIIDAWGPKMVVCNFYGPSECSIGVTANLFIGPDARPSNIGPLFPNVGAFVLEPGTDRPVMRGAIGELCVSGKLVGKGYLNRPDLTAASFPYLDHLGMRVYRTGDLVRVLADGSFLFIGRKDTQTKLRGQRLEIEEINKTIKTSCDGLVDAISIVIKTGDGAKETLVSFIISESKSRQRELRVDTSTYALEWVSQAMAACQSRLPPYMVPTHVIPLSFLPLTVNNKVDSKRLVALYHSLTTNDLQALGRTSIEQLQLDSTGQKIGSVLCRYLGIDVEHLSPRSNLFSLGLSSVSAIPFTSFLKREGFPAASVPLIMKHPTLGDLSKALSYAKTHTSPQDLNRVKQSQLSITAFDQRHRMTVAAALSTDAREIEAVMPCTALQEGLILESIRQESRPYFNTFRYRLDNIDLDRLRSSFEDLTKAVQVLRTRFIQTKDGFAQVILRTASLPWSATSAVRTSERKSVWLTDNSIDLLRPLEVHVLQRGSAHMMEIFMHHAIYDGISHGVLLERLAETYRTRIVSDCGPDFSAALIHGPLVAPNGAKSFWEEQLHGMSYVPLPMIEGTKPRATTTVAVSDVLETRKIETLRKKLGVSHQALLQACFEVAMHQQYPQTTVYGAIVSGRSFAFEGAESVIGPLFNTLPATVITNRTDTWATLIRNRNRANADVLPYQHTPLRNIQWWCGRGPSNPLFDVLFVFQHGKPQSHGLWTEVEQEPHAEYPLSFEITYHDAQSMDVSIVAQNHYVDQNSANALLQSFADALCCAYETSDSPIQEHFRWINYDKPTRIKTQPRGYDDLNGVVDFEWTPEARSLQEIIAQVAGLDPSNVDEHCSIFSLGIDSIDTVKLASRAKLAGLQLPVSKILKAQTIPRMLEMLQDRIDPRAMPKTFKLKKFERQLTEALQPGFSDDSTVQRILPATPNQEALIADMLRSDYKEYYNHDVLLLQPDVDLGRLQNAWQSVVKRNPILRTGFLQVDEPNIEVAFAQLVHKPSRIKIQRQEVSEQDDIRQLLGSITDDVRSSRPGLPPLRLNLVDMHDQHYLILSLSHAQYDGHSLALLHEDVSRAYRDELHDRPGSDQLIEQSLEATSGESRDFWSSVLMDIRSSRLPVVHATNAIDVTYRVQRRAAISAESARSFCQKHAVSMQALAQACWSLTLAHHTHSLEAVFGVVLACRDSEDAEQVMFPAMNTIVMRAALHGLRHEIVRSVQSNIDEMRPYQRTPLRFIQQACGDTLRSANQGARDGLFDTLFIFQQRPSTTNDNAEKLYESVDGSSNVEYPVAVEMEHVDEAIVLRAAVKGIVFDQPGASNLLEHLDLVLEAVVNAPDEQTVDFTDEGVSVCSLPSFELDDRAYKISPSPYAPKDGEVGSETFDDLLPLARIIRDVLAQVSKISMDDISPTATIESIGIDSISAIKVASLLRKQSIQLSVGEIIQARSIRRMADIAAFKTAQVNGNSASSPATTEAIQEFLAHRDLTKVPSALGAAGSNVESILPATAGQIYMLSVWRKSAGQLFYPSFRYELRGLGSNYDQIKAAWLRLVDRHAILRTVFFTTRDHSYPALQVILKHVEDNCYQGDEKSQRRQPLGVQPMVSLRVRKGAKTRHVLELTIHHALYDAVSLPLLLEDFRVLLNGSDIQLEPPRLTQADFAVLSLKKDSQQARQRFWTSHLQDANLFSGVQEIDVTRPQTRVELFHPGLLLDSTALEQHARREGVTVQSLFFAAYAKTYAATLARLTTASHDGNSSPEATRQKPPEDVVLGIYLANRSHLPDLSTSLTSPTVNIVPLLVRNAQQRSILEIAKQIHADLQLISNVDNSAVSLWEIERWTGVKVHTIVNFLKTFDDEISDSRDDDTGSRLVQVGEKRVGYKRVVQPEETKDVDEFVVPRELEGLKEMESAYLATLDIEATVVDGALDVGVFCPNALLDLEGAEQIVSELKSAFEGLIA